MSLRLGNTIVAGAISDTSAFATKTELATKVNISDLTECHTVIETYKNGTDWYRLYDDGWVEQGGMCNISQDTVTTVNLLKSMSDTTYIILITARKDGSTQTGGDGNFTADPKSTTQFYWRNGDDFTGYGYWEVKGYAAQ